jgi:1-acyl-sn-glycerol-3-phosphate acyltransferase
VSTASSGIPTPISASAPRIWERSLRRHRVTHCAGGRRIRGKWFFIDAMPLLKVLRSTWIWTASAFLVLLWTPLLFVVWLFDRDSRRIRTGRWFRRLGRTLAKLNPWRIRFSGLENVQPDAVYVIVSNHQSLADIPLISHLRIDTKWLAKAELFRVPLLGWMLRMAGDIPVERSDKRKSARALMQCAQYLRKQCSVVFFPEGRRSPDGQVLPFAEGPFQLAIREQVPILPLVVEGSGNALPKNSWLFGATQPIQLQVLPAVSVADRDPRQSADLRDSVRQKIVDELCRLRSVGSED